MVDAYAFGRRSAETLRLQRALGAIGIDAGPEDGIFGHATRTAVEAAERRFGLAVTGRSSPGLLTALGLPAAPARNPLQDLFLGLALRAALNRLKGALPMTILAGYKTYIIAAVMLLLGVAGLLGIDVPNFTSEAPGDLVMQALAFFFLRQGLKKVG